MFKMAAFDFSFSFQTPKKTAKQKLSNIGLKVIKTFRPDGKVKYFGVSFDIVNILLGELSKVDEATAQKVVDEIQKELNT
jgi:hypothetical protein